MKAVVYREPGRRPQLEDVELDPPRAGEVLVEIRAAGVCHSDLHVALGDWDTARPAVMGHEGAGVVVETGPGVETPARGDHVTLSWWPACGSCRRCLAGYPSQCGRARDLAAAGVLYDGTTRLHRGSERLHHYLAVSSFAQYAVVPAAGAVPIPPAVPFGAAALIGCCVATGVGAVQHTADVQPGQTVAVIGCGAVGLCAVQGARIAGAARIVAIDLLEAKLGLAAALGATDTVDGSAGDPVAAVHELLGAGVDYAFDCVGAAATTDLAIRLLDSGGAAVLVGLPPTGTRVQIDPLVLNDVERRILTSNYGSVRPAVDFPAFAGLYLDGTLRIDELISARRPLAEVQEALDDLAAGRAVRTILSA